MPSALGLRQGQGDHPAARQRPSKARSTWRSSSHPLPDLVAALNGQIASTSHGHVDSIKDGIRNSFEVVPDAPVSRFELTLKGGEKYGLLENHENLCAHTQRASARFIGQNGKVAQLGPRITNDCGRGKAQKKRPKHKGHHKHGQAGG